MNAKTLRRASVIESADRLPPAWARLSVAAAVLASVGSVIGLLGQEYIYGRATPDLYNAAIAQDLVNLFLVAPLMLFLAVRASQGSRRSWLGLIGFLVFTAYNYAIYTFSIQFGPLFLVWVAVLGLSVFASAGSLAALIRPGSGTPWVNPAVRLPGFFLIGMAVCFALLWLNQIVPDLLAGRPSTSAATYDVPTNPVHVLDLAFFIPAVTVSGMLLLRRHRSGYASAPGPLIFLGLTCLPILAIPFIAQARGDAPGWAILVPIGTAAAATVIMLWRLLHAMRPASVATQGESS